MIFKSYRRDMKADSVWSLLFRGFWFLAFSSVVLMPFFSTDFYGSQAPDNRININVAHVSLRPYDSEGSGGVLWLKNLFMRYFSRQSGYFSSGDAGVYSLDYSSLEEIVKQGLLLPGNDRLIDDITILLENEAAQLISFSGVTPEMVEQISYAYYESLKPAISVAASSLYQYHSPVFHLRYHRSCQLMIVSKFPMTNDWQYIAPYEKETKHPDLEDWQCVPVEEDSDPFAFTIQAERDDDIVDYSYACALPVRIIVKGSPLVFVSASITSMKAFDSVCKVVADRKPNCLNLFFQHLRSRFSPHTQYDTSVDVIEALLLSGFWGAGVNHHCKKGLKGRLPRKSGLKAICENMGVLVKPVQEGLVTLSAMSDNRVKDWYQWHHMKPPECDYLADFIGYSLHHKFINLQMSPLRALTVPRESDGRAYSIVYRTVEISP